MPRKSGASPSSHQTIITVSIQQLAANKSEMSGAFKSKRSAHVHSSIMLFKYCLYKQMDETKYRLRFPVSYSLLQSFDATLPAGAVAGPG
jgi:hypothetical protein